MGIRGTKLNAYSYQKFFLYLITMRGIALFVIGVLALGVTASDDTRVATGKRFPWPLTYRVSWKFSIPYVETLQEGGMEYTYEVLQDYEQGRQKVVRDGVETTIIDGGSKVSYQIFPRVDSMVCWIFKADKESGPTRRLAMKEGNGGAWLGSEDGLGESDPRDYLGFVLPDLSEDRWKYHGRKDGGDVDVWVWDLTEGKDMDMHYTFYVDARTHAPVKLVMKGINLYTGGHKDIYIADYYDFEEIQGGFAPEEFLPPSDMSCEKQDDENGVPAAMRTIFHQHAPSMGWGHREYDVYSHSFGRRHGNQGEYEERLGYFLKNSEYIRTKDDTASFEVGHNHFMDWSDGEYAALLGHRYTKDENTSRMVTLRDLVSSEDFLPGEVSWKGSIADAPPKDQAACGSCWAFSAIAALESAVSRCTGKQHLLSEQSLIDCNWDEKNTGCFGGEQKRAFEWVFHKKDGGLFLSDDYHYKGINDFCQSKKKNDAKIRAKGDYKIVESGEKAVMAALALKGPLAVSVDADDPDFRFYTKGVYSNSKCQMDPTKLSHAVILSGYGVDEATGKKYWLVKNTWSKYWGEDGYIRIEREPNDCGIASEAQYVDIDCKSLKSLDV